MEDKSTKMHRITIDITPEMHARLQALKESHGQNIAGAVRVAVREYLERVAPTVDAPSRLSPPPK